MVNFSPLTSMRAASCNGASGAANSGPSVLLGRSRVTLSRLWCYAGIRQVLPGSQSRRCPEAHHEANRCNLGHVTPKTLQKALYVGFSQTGRPLQVVWCGWSQFPIPEARLAGRAALTRTFHTRVAADVSRRHLVGEQNAPTDVGGYTLSANRAECEISGLAPMGA